MGQLNTIKVYQLVESRLVPGTGLYPGGVEKAFIPAKWELSLVDPESIISLAPFIVIFANYQTDQLDTFEKNVPKGLKILFKGRPAHNRVHPGAPLGNVIMVVDKDE